jgi:hypothetical protein
MNRRRHVAALALVGWYLMTPPWRQGKDGFEERLELPLSKWVRTLAFDSAAECEAVRDQLIKVEKDASISARAVSDMCVESDDLRLKPKSATQQFKLDHSR